MHLTPVQRLRVLTIYFALVPNRSFKRAKKTSEIAAQQNIEISESGVKKIIAKWRKMSKFKYNFL